MPWKTRALADTKSPGDVLRPVLLAYLQASRVPGWPGADGLTESDILDCYPQAIRAGAVPDGPELCRSHPELIAEIQAFFALKGWPDRSSRDGRP